VAHKIEKPPRIRKSGFPVFGFDYNSSQFNCNRNSAELRKSGFPVFTLFRATARRINLSRALVLSFGRYLQLL
jgi:hypothetical protein